MNFKQTSISIFKIVAFIVALGFITRIMLLCLPITDAHFPAIDYVKVFLFGFVNDVCIAIIASIFMELHLLFSSNKKYKKPFGYLILGLLLCLLGYLYFFKTIFDEYGNAAPLVAKLVVGLATLIFAIFLFFPKTRQNFRFGLFSMLFFVYVFLFLLNVVSEYFFWNEFGVRYNFIAVDYLVYTNEVIGNIFESYPIIPMLVVLVAISLIITYLFVKNSRKEFKYFMNWRGKLVHFLIYGMFFVSALYLLKGAEKFETSDSVFANEIQSNGLYKFYKAAKSASLSFEEFYQQIPEYKAFAITNSIYQNIEGLQNVKIITDSLPEIKKNVVLVTIESLSGSFLAHFGNKENITPNLDQLADEGIFFTQLFATGNRTVRGLEALTLSLPPTAGESIVKRENNGDYFSTGYVFRQKGYTTQFLYGGFSYFDNMKKFYEGNGYQVIDRNMFDKDEITFANIWGVCDEDMFRKALKVFDENAQSGKPFFAQIMSVSNHRPFTYPDGKIDIPGNVKSRAGGVKYTDYAIGKFMEEAKKRSWFENTIFIFTADHCASSQGKTSIPLVNYHIPAILYAPDFIEPQQITKVASQIDLLPTLFGLLHFSYESKFYGQNVFDSAYQPRALAATYEELGYFRDSILTILSPVKKISQYVIQSDSTYHYPATKILEINPKYADEAIAHYQTAVYIIENEKNKIK
ncbi:MAG: sulfatase-like hydrolase/transferase [Candidatus Azobacteroides sp.]|nr:sulfatase-like hydrolase/transferase [Candidatus Azobacteroides sp.]